MNFPAYTPTPTYSAQAILDAVDYATIAAGSQNNGVLSGCTISPSSGMTVSVASGFVAYNGIRYAVPATTITVNAASSGDRRDAIYVTLSNLNLSSGASAAFGYAAGTPSTVAGWIFTSTSAPPVKPNLPANSILVAEIYVRGSDAGATTTITSTEIIDKRIFLALNVANPIQGINLSVYGHSFTQGALPAVKIIGQSAITRGWPPFQTSGGQKNGNGQTWPNRLAEMYQTIDQTTGLSGLRNAGQPGTTVQTTTASFISGWGEPVLDGAYFPASPSYSYARTGNYDVNGVHQFNPGHDNETYYGLSYPSAEPITASGLSLPTNPDSGINLFQCAVNDTNDLRNLNPVGSYAAEIQVPYGSSGATGVVTFTRNGVGSTFACSNAFTSTSSTTLSTVVSAITTQLATCGTALSSAMSVGGYSTTVTAKYPIAGITPTAANTGLTCASSGTSAIIVTLGAGLAGDASNYLQVGDIIYIQGASNGYPSGGSQFAVASFDTNNRNKVNLNYVVSGTTASQNSTLTNAPILIMNRMVVEGSRPFPITDFTTQTTAGTPNFQYLGTGNSVSSMSYALGVTMPKSTPDFIAAPPHAAGQFASGSTAGLLKIVPWTVTTTATNKTITTSGPPVLGRKTVVMIANASYDGGPLITTVNYQSGTNTYVLADAPQLSITNGKMWALPARYDNFAIGWTSGKLVIPPSAKGGTLTVWSQYWSSTAPVTISYNGGTSTDLANIVSAIGTVTGITPTTSGSLTTGATLTFSSTPIDFWFDFTTLTQANPNQVATGAVWTPAATAVTTGKTTNNSSGTGTLVTDADVSGTVSTGWEIVGSGIAKGTYVTAISGTNITMSQAPSGASNLTNSIGITFIPPAAQFYASGDPVWNGTPFTADLQVPIVTASGATATYTGGNSTGIAYLGWWHGAPSTVTGTSDGSSSPVWQGSLIGAKDAWKDSLRTALRWARCDNTASYNPVTGNATTSSAGINVQNTQASPYSAAATVSSFNGTNVTYSTTGTLPSVGQMVLLSGFAPTEFTGVAVVTATGTNQFSVANTTSRTYTTATGTYTIIKNGAGSGYGDSHYYSYSGHNKVGDTRYTQTAQLYSNSLDGSGLTRFDVYSGALPAVGQVVYMTANVLDSANSGATWPAFASVVTSVTASTGTSWFTTKDAAPFYTQNYLSAGSYTTTGTTTLFGTQGLTNVPAAGVLAARIGGAMKNSLRTGVTVLFTNGSTTATITGSTANFANQYISTDATNVTIQVGTAVSNVSGSTITLSKAVTVAGGGTASVSVRTGGLPQDAVVSYTEVTNVGTGAGTIHMTSASGNGVLTGSSSSYTLYSPNGIINARYLDWWAYGDSAEQSKGLYKSKDVMQTASSTQWPQVGNFNSSPGYPVAPHAQSDKTALNPETRQWYYLTACSLRTNATNGTYSSYTLLAADASSTGEIVVLYPAHPRYDTSWTSVPNWSIDAQVNGTGAVKKIQRASDFPFLDSTYPWTQLNQSPMSALLTTNNGVTVGSKNNSVVLSKTAGDSGANIAEFDCVFTTTQTPPWCVFVPDPTAVGGLVYGNYQYQDFMQAYNDLSAEAEFAWYVGVVPPIQTLTYDDLAHSGNDHLHPNQFGAAKVAQAVGQYLSSMMANFFITTPYPRPYGSGSTDGLKNRIGYWD